VVSIGEETEKQAAALGRGATRRDIAAVVMRVRRVGSRMDREAATIREGESGDFLFLFSCGRQCCVLSCSDVEVHQRLPGRNGRLTHNIIVSKFFVCLKVGDLKTD
jgi:hypothetical protein